MFQRLADCPVGLFEARFAASHLHIIHVALGRRAEQNDHRDATVIVALRRMTAAVRQAITLTGLRVEQLANGV